MIIRCTACQTRFRLADDKMKPDGVRVRCTNCDQVFTALPPQSPTSRPAGRSTASSEVSDPALESAKSTNTARPPAPDAPEFDFDFGEFNMEELEDPSTDPPEQTTDFSGISFDDKFDQPRSAAAHQGDSDELPPLEDFNLDDEAFADFDFDESAASGETALDFSLDEAANIGGDLGVTFDVDTSDEALPELDRSALGTQEFFFDDTPDEPLLDASAEPSDTGPVEFSFDSNEDPFAFPKSPGATETTPSEHDEFVFEGAGSSQKEAAVPAAGTAAVAVETRKKPVADKQFRRDKLPAEPAPRRSSHQPKTKPRKKASGYRSAVIFVLLILVGAAGYGYFGWQQGTYEPAILIERAQFLIMGQTNQEMSGQIDITDLSSQFVINQSAGNLFVVRGRAVNNFSGARSTISVRGIIYDTTGKAILQQTAFCGNPLDQAALRTLPYAKIEETMNNQFGDSLSNLNIGPGQSLPFTIVFRNIPDQVAEFNIEVADSRPGTQ